MFSPFSTSCGKVDKSRCGYIVEKKEKRRKTRVFHLEHHNFADLECGKLKDQGKIRLFFHCIVIIMK